MFSYIVKIGASLGVTTASRRQTPNCLNEHLKNGSDGGKPS